MSGSANILERLRLEQGNKGNIEALSSAYGAGDLSPVSVVENLFERIGTENSRLHAYCYLETEGALEAARAAELRWKRGEALGLLDGIPVALKDNIAAKGMPAYWGASGTSDVPSSFDSCAVERLRDAGAILLGKSAMSEMGYYASDANSRYEGARNPWNPDRTAGGSSGGSAAAVAADLCAVALGGDGAGSIRMPSSFCGVVGLKPSGGRVPVLPPIGLNPVVGPIARTVRDAAIVLREIARPDERDYHALPLDPPDYLAALSCGTENMRIGYLPFMGYGDPVHIDVLEAVQKVVAALEGEGAKVDELAPIFQSDLLDEIADAGLPYQRLLALQLTGGETGSLLHPTQAMLAYAGGIGLASHLIATRRSGEAVHEFCTAALPYDVLITPTVTCAAFEAGAPFPPGAKINRFGYAFGFGAFVHIANLASVPACSVPCGEDREGLPIGLQVIGKRYREETVLKVASACERLSAASSRSGRSMIAAEAGRS